MRKLVVECPRGGGSVHARLRAAGLFASFPLLACLNSAAPANAGTAVVAVAPAIRAEEPGLPPPVLDSIFGFGEVSAGCPTSGLIESLRSGRAVLYESDCGMEIVYRLPDGGSRMFRFDTSARGERGAALRILEGEERAVIITEKLAVVVPGPAGEQVRSSVDIVLPAGVRAHAFDGDSMLCLLTNEGRVYATDVVRRDANWRKTSPQEGVREDAVLAMLGDTALVIQPGDTPVISVRGVAAESGPWRIARHPQRRAFSGPFRVEEKEGRLVVEYSDGALEISISEAGPRVRPLGGSCEGQD